MISQVHELLLIKILLFHIITELYFYTERSQYAHNCLAFFYILSAEKNMHLFLDNI